MIANPKAPAYKLLLLLGRDDAQVQQAAQALAVAAGSVWQQPGSGPAEAAAAAPGL
jgi:hypothetical protein